MRVNARSHREAGDSGFEDEFVVDEALHVADEALRVCGDFFDEHVEAVAGDDLAAEDDVVAAHEA